MREHIRKLAKEKGFTFYRIAERLNLSRCQLSTTLSGNPTIKTLSRIASVLDVELCEMFPRKVSGFLEFNGKVVSIKSVLDLEKALIELKQTDNVDIMK